MLSDRGRSSRSASHRRRGRPERCPEWLRSLGSPGGATVPYQRHLATMQHRSHFELPPVTVRDRHLRTECDQSVVCAWPESAVSWWPRVGGFTGATPALRPPGAVIRDGLPPPPVAQNQSFYRHASSGGTYAFAVDHEERGVPPPSPPIGWAQTSQYPPGFDYKPLSRRQKFGIISLVCFAIAGVFSVIGAYQTGPTIQALVFQTTSWRGGFPCAVRCHQRARLGGPAACIRGWKLFVQCDNNHISEQCVLSS
jgi:hypothetical protein